MTATGEAADAQFQTGNPDETKSLAESLGALLSPGAVVCLTGNLGAGKTTFTQGLARGLGLPPDEPVNSPTFTLIAEHPGGRLPLYHFDVYRLDDSSGLFDIAYDEYLDAGGVMAIEWADRISDALPADRIDIRLQTTGGDTRIITMVGRGDAAASVRALSKQWNRAQTP